MAGGITAALLAAARPRGSDRRASWGCSRSTRRGLPAVLAELRPRVDPARQPLPRPARPLRRARDDRRPLARRARVARRGADARARAERGRPTRRGARPRTRAPALLRRRGRLARAAAYRARRRRQALPQLRRAVRLRRGLRRPSRPYHCPACGERRPQPRVYATRRSRSRASARPASRCTRRMARRRSSCRCPGSTTSTTRSPRRRPRTSLGVPLEAVGDAACGHARRVRPRRDASVVGDASC